MADRVWQQIQQERRDSFARACAEGTLVRIDNVTFDGPDACPTCGKSEQVGMDVHVNLNLKLCNPVPSTGETYCGRLLSWVGPWDAGRRCPAHRNG